MALTTVSSLAESYVSGPALDCVESEGKDKDVIKMVVDVSDCVVSGNGDENGVSEAAGVVLVPEKSPLMASESDAVESNATRSIQPAPAQGIDESEDDDGVLQVHG